MVVNRLARSWEVDLYNEEHPQAFVKWRLRDTDTIQTLIQQSNARTVLFKPILDTHRACSLLEQFSDAKVIFAFRHYHDVVNSALRRFGPSGWRNRVSRWMKDDFAEFSAAPPPLQTCQRVRRYWRPTLSSESAIALYWLFYNSLYYDLELHGDSRVRLARYETAVSFPQQEFNGLCKFLSIRFVSGMTEGIVSTSVEREAQPEIEQEIQTECETLWQMLSKDASVTDSVAQVLE